MNATNDDDLSRQFERDPEGAFRAVYERYSSPLFRFIFRFTQNREASEEILHDLFLELLAGKFASGHLKSWLFEVAKNKSLNHSKKAARPMVAERVLESLPDSRDLEPIVLAERRLERLVQAERRLPEDLEKTWRLRKQGLDYREIAERLEIPLGTVKSRFARLVEFLRKEMKA